MSEWAMKRFWRAASVHTCDGGYQIKLDSRTVRTPAKAELIVPTREIAQLVAAEWDAQEERVDPVSMPWTRSSNAAIDKVATQRAEVEAHLAEYAGTDLLCYRAEQPEALAERQREAWDPLLDWARTVFGAGLDVTAGVMPIGQVPDALSCLTEQMRPMSDFQITAFHDLVSLSGSFVLALAVTEGRTPAETAWDTSRIDEKWQIEQWGHDEESAEHAEIKQSAFLHAARFYQAA